MRNIILTLAATCALVAGGLTWTDTAEARPWRRGWYGGPVVRYSYRPYYYGYRTSYRPYYGYRYYRPYYYSYGPYYYPRYSYGYPYYGGGVYVY